MRKTILVLSLLLLPAFETEGRGRFAQLVLSFHSQKEYKYHFNPKEYSLVLNIRNTTPAELDALNHYDESLIRRILVKETGLENVEIRMVLKDAAVRATVHDFSEPFRITIDLFDLNYKIPRDPKSGLPMVGSNLLATESGTMATDVPAAPSTHTYRDGGVHPTPDQISPSLGGTKKRLLQSVPQNFHRPEDLIQTISKIDPGIGKSLGKLPGLHLSHPNRSPRRAQS